MLKSILKSKSIAELRGHRYTDNSCSIKNFVKTQIEIQSSALIVGSVYRLTHSSIKALSYFSLMIRLAYFLGIILFYILISASSCKQSPSAPSQPTEGIAIDDLYHHTVGQGDPILVIHGGPGLGSAYMENHLAPLAEYHQLIFYDQRNSGRSSL